MSSEVSRNRAKVIGIRIDIETRSGEDIKKSGVYRYAEDPDFKVLTISYSTVREYPGGAIKISEPRRLSDTPSEVAKFQTLLADPTFEKHAYNAAFERVCLSMWAGMPAGTYYDPVNWHCSAVKANVNGVYGTLDEVAKVLRSPITKDPEGKRLINLFSKRDRKTGRFHSTTTGVKNPCWCGLDHRADMTKFSLYCNNDVKTEAVVAHLLGPVPDSVQAEYEADQRINDRGFRHHKRMSEMAVLQVNIEKDNVMADMRALTGVENPNSGPQLQTWLNEQGYPMASLDKAHREEALEDALIPDEVAEMLEMKGRASLSSVAKHQAALNTRCGDGRIRGALQFYGAHTGREAGRGIQPQNLPRYEAPMADAARLLHGSAGRDAPTIAKGTVRGTIIPARGYEFVVCDYNAIEARVLGGLAGEKWVEEEFRIGAGKIYERTAEAMFGTDYAAMIANLKACDKCGSCPDCMTRSKSKVAELAFGYAGGAGAMVTMGAASAGIDVGNFPELKAEWKALGSPGRFHQWEADRHDYPELLRMRDLYRSARPATVRFWKLCAKAWDLAAAGKGARFGQDSMLSMVRDGRNNRLVLPSGRSIWYRNAKAHRDPENHDWVERRTFVGKSGGIGHTRVDTHGGKLTENVTQAVARDLLFDLIMRIEAEHARGWPGRLVLHVHDEVVLEVPKAQSQQVLADTLGMMSQSPDWGKVFAVKGEGKIMQRYGK